MILKESVAKMENKQDYTSDFRIREIRQELKLSGIAIADKLEISAQYYYDLEKGERNLSVGYAIQLSYIFNVSLDYLLGISSENSRAISSNDRESLKDISIGEFIRKHRILSGYDTQNQLSKASGVSQTTLSRVEKDKQVLKLETLVELAKHLKTTNIDELLFVSGFSEVEEQKWNREHLNIINASNQDELKKYSIEVDGQELNELELKSFLAYIRSFRELTENK